MGLGPLVGRLFMIMTTTGRKSGQPRRAAIEYHVFGGRKYVFAGWPRSDWYQNMLRDPRMTIQTHAGAESVIGRRVTDDAELAAAWDFATRDPVIQMAMALMNVRLTREAFIAHKDRYHIVTFDSTDQPCPPPLQADLAWLLPALAFAFGAGWLAGQRAGRRARHKSR
jgi:deazaflavin-dependent oxidoreductase (nitroreductase family)